MVYEYKQIICPYNQPNGHYVHKGCDKLCMFKNNEIKCRAYNEWLELKKDDCEPSKCVTEVSHE